ncbi:MAG: serine acetyltransferase [Peptostreptococcaceae bacterium]|nr:serine acetyltransferase [Peptostreptococcaceae bacterium]
MIKSKNDYKYYLKCDLESSGIKNFRIIDRIFERRFKFYKSLRLTEYYTNCKKGPVGRIIAKILRKRHRLICDKYNWTIPINVFDEGLAIIHTGPIVVSHKAKIGKNCRIHVCVNIGSAWVKGNAGAPVIGNNVYIAPGVKILGPIKIGDNTAIGANAVVNKQFIEGNYTIAGVPASIVSYNDSSKYILKY